MILREASQPTWTRQLGRSATGFWTLYVVQFQICSVKTIMYLPRGHRVFTKIAIIVKLKYGLYVEPFVGRLKII